MLKLTTDHVFHIGVQHLRSGMPCQDYALSGVHYSGAYAVVADGCSGGGMTDVGARVIGLATADALAASFRATAEGIAEKQRTHIALGKDLLGLRQNDMLATCCYATINSNGEGLVHIRGDGVIALVSNNGNIDMIRLDWAQNMPLYMAYADDNFAGFIRAHGGDREAEVLTCNSYSIGAGGVMLSGTWNVSLQDALLGHTITITPDLAATLKYIAVFSDGVTQVDGVAWHAAVLDLLAFKSPAGQFASRRMNRFLDDAHKAGSKGPIDDIAYAVIHLETQPVEQTP